MYRPTVRYDDVFKEYIDGLFHATHLDRNQIIRAALFAAAYSKEFQELMTEHKKKDVPLPPPLWKSNQHRYWMERTPKKEGGKDIHDICRGTKKVNKNTGDIERRGNRTEENRCIRQIKGRTREIPSEPIRIRNQGGITFTIN
jgi:hypothetical protein